MHDPKYYAIGASRWKGQKGGKGDPYFYELGGAPNMEAQPWFMKTPGGEQPGIVAPEQWNSLGAMGQPNFMLGQAVDEQPNFMYGNNPGSLGAIKGEAQPWFMKTPGGSQPGIVAPTQWNSLGDEPVVPFDYQGRTYGLGEMAYAALGDMSPMKCLLISTLLASVAAAGVCYYMMKRKSY